MSDQQQSRVAQALREIEKIETELKKRNGTQSASGLDDIRERLTEARSEIADVAIAEAYEELSEEDKDPQITQEQAWKAFLAGFENTAEGFNGEMLFEASESEKLRERFDDWWEDA